MKMGKEGGEVNTWLDGNKQDQVTSTEYFWIVITVNGKDKKQDVWRKSSIEGFKDCWQQVKYY